MADMDDTSGAEERDEPDGPSGMNAAVAAGAAAGGPSTAGDDESLGVDTNLPGEDDLSRE